MYADLEISRELRTSLETRRSGSLFFGEKSHQSQVQAMGDLQVAVSEGDREYADLEISRGLRTSLETRSSGSLFFREKL